MFMNSTINRKIYILFCNIIKYVNYSIFHFYSKLGIKGNVYFHYRTSQIQNVSTSTLSYNNLSFQDTNKEFDDNKRTFLGKPGIVTIRIRSSVIRIQITRRAISIISITTKPSRKTLYPLFQPIQSVLEVMSHCITYQMSIGFAGIASPLFRLHRNCVY